jgi:hypothetical protein
MWTQEHLPQEHLERANWSTPSTRRVGRKKCHSTCGVLGMAGTLVEPWLLRDQGQEFRHVFATSAGNRGVLVWAGLFKRNRVVKMRAAESSKWLGSFKSPSLRKRLAFSTPGWHFCCRLYTCKEQTISLLEEMGFILIEPGCFSLELTYCWKVFLDNNAFVWSAQWFLKIWARRLHMAVWISTCSKASRALATQGVYPSDEAL